MADTPRWRPRLSVSLACKWLNVSTYAGIQVADPCSPDPTQSYLLSDLAGRLRVSRLHNPLQPNSDAFTLLEQWLAVAEDYISRGMFQEALAQLPHIERLGQRSQFQAYVDPLQMTEARLLMGWLYYRTRRNAKALAQFQQSVKEFMGIDDHAEALSRWAAGHVLLERSRPKLDEGLFQWQRAWEIFARAGSDSFRRTRMDAQWYEKRAALMAVDLHGAAQAGGVAPPELALFTPIPISPWAVDTAPAAEKAPAGEIKARLLLRNVPVLDSVRADAAGRVVSPPAAEFAEFNTVRINRQPHHLLEVGGQGVVPVRPGDHYAFVRVSDDSLDAASPQPIFANDYVLVRANAAPADGQIVVALLREAGPGDQPLVKRKSSDGFLYAESRAVHLPLPISKVARFIGEVVAIARLAE